MIYVFEDKRSSNLSKLFCAAYPDEISKQFIYADGNGNLLSAIIDRHDGTVLYNDYIIVYIDMIPGNKYLNKLYNNLRRFSRKNNFCIIVLPIVCAEWYFISSFRDSVVLRNTHDVNLCLCKEFFKDSELYKKYPNEISSFEKFCKKL